jgi:hypothetical protein
MTGSREGRQAALFEKSAQKLLLLWDCGGGTPPHQINRSFLVLFFKKELLSLVCLPHPLAFSATHV